MTVKKTILFIALALLAAVLLAMLCANPIISAEGTLPQEYRDAIRSQAGGLYSRRLPLLPVAVTVEEVQQEKVFYTIHYFPFGTVGMSYHIQDGYNMEKTLTKLQ